MITMMGNLWEALRMKKQDTCEQLLAACWKVSGNRERTFAHSILVSLGLKVNDFPHYPMRSNTSESHGSFSAIGI